MKFSLEYLQRDFYRKNKALELEGLLPSQRLAQLQEGIQDISLDLLPKNQSAFSQKSYFSKARDLWRGNAKVKKIVTSHNLVELAYQLTSEKPIRLAFDQLLPALETSKDPTDYPSFYKKETVQKLSAIQELLSLLIICVEGEGRAPDFAASDPFPSTPGNGVYLSPEYEIDFQKLYSRKNQTFLLIGYAKKISQYFRIEEDPQVHELKKLGYVFGDKLNDSVHPILLR
ncbi:hypothetical protein PHSC3_000576 [Chlamydiales bacterium STE3]|nr:hypothetical protein PHSC3_000576 [Chlamydiales bacterium STE3]